MFFKEKKEKILPIQDIEIQTWAETVSSFV